MKEERETQQRGRGTVVCGDAHRIKETSEWGLEEAATSVSPPVRRRALTPDGWRLRLLDRLIN